MIIKDEEDVIVKLEPLNEKSKNLFLTGDHVLIGVSPFNSYYTSTRIKQLTSWVAKRFKKINIFIPDKISKFTLESIGYTTEQAIQKTRRQDSYLKNKVIKSFISHGLSLKESEEKLVSLSSLFKSNKYCEIHEACLQEFNNNSIFQEDCLTAAKNITFGGRKPENFSSTRVTVDYFLYELPLFLNTPAILNVDSSVFIYHNPPPSIKRIFMNSSLVSKKQGFIIVSLTETREL
jgi:cyclo(L-tyrosyl-L-tyrosyl) synthase